MSNRLAKDYLQIIHEINVIDDKIHNAEIQLLTIKNSYQREAFEVSLKKLNRERDALYLLESNNITRIERKVLYEKLCEEIGKLETDEYMKEAFKDFIMLD